MLGIIAYIMRFAVGGAIETVAIATGDVDSILIRNIRKSCLGLFSRHDRVLDDRIYLYFA